MQGKAKKIETFRDKYFTTIIYEYRGFKYEVTYSNGWQVCSTPAWVQHRDAQAKIDKMIENPGTEHTAVDLDEIWELMGW